MGDGCWFQQYHTSILNQKEGLRYHTSSVCMGTAILGILCARLLKYNIWAFIQEFIQEMRYHKMKLIFYAWIKIAIGPPSSELSGINGIHNGKSRCQSWWFFDFCSLLFTPYGSISWYCCQMCLGFLESAVGTIHSGRIVETKNIVMKEMVVYKVVQSSEKLHFVWKHSSHQFQ